MKFTTWCRWCIRFQSSSLLLIKLLVILWVLKKSPPLKLLFSDILYRVWQWMLFKSTYLSILGITILSWLQVTIVNTASFSTLRLQNVKYKAIKNKLSGLSSKKARRHPLKISRERASISSTTGEFIWDHEHTNVTPSKKILSLTWVDDHWAAAIAVLATEKALTRLPSGRTKSLKPQRSNHVILSQLAQLVPPYYQRSSDWYHAFVSS